MTYRRWRGDGSGTRTERKGEARGARKALKGKDKPRRAKNEQEQKETRNENEEEWEQGKGKMPQIPGMSTREICSGSRHETKRRAGARTNFEDELERIRQQLDDTRE